MNATLVFWAVGAAALIGALNKLRIRLRLSRAKHPSLRGHARMSRWFATMVPFYEYDEERFFRSDDAPEPVAARRRAGFTRLAELYRQRFAETVRVTGEAEQGISDLQFTSVYRVPFQYS